MGAPPNLAARLQQVKAAVRELPQIAARQLDQLADQAHAKQMAPDGTHWKPVVTKKEAAGATFDEGVGRFRVRGRFAAGRGPGRDFDPQHHIQYHPRLVGSQVQLVSTHRAAPFARWGTPRMAARPTVPGRNDSLGWWLPLILQALRLRLSKEGG